MFDLEKEIKQFILDLAAVRINAVRRYKHKANNHIPEGLLIHLSLAVKAGDYDRAVSLLIGTLLISKINIPMLTNFLSRIPLNKHKAIVLYTSGKLNAVCNIEYEKSIYNSKPCTHRVNGEYIELYKHGGSKKRSFYNEQGVEHGECFEFSQTGVVLRFEHMENGQATGEGYFLQEHTLGYHSSVYCKDGKLNGLVSEIYLNKNKQKKKEQWYENGKANGPYTEWYPDGILKTSGHYVDNKLDGRFIHFDTDGSELTVSNYKNNLLHGNVIKHSKQIGHANFNGVEYQAHYTNGVLDGDISALYLTDDGDIDCQNYNFASVTFNLGIPDLS